MSQKKHTILLVDDSSSNLDILIDFLDQFELIDVMDGFEALEILDDTPIDLILLDINMPNIDGFEVCRRVKENPKTKNIPVIFITAKTDEDTLEEAYNVGGIDYVTKPFRKKELLSRVNTHLTLANQKAFLEDTVAKKTSQLTQMNSELEQVQKELVWAIGVVGESRCSDTGAHVHRVAYYSELLAKLYGLADDEIEVLKQASPMHDIGKVAIADNILNKPAKLTAEEFEIMKSHSEVGYNMFKNSTMKLLQAASIISHQHHEKWDGTGYPQKLKGEEIHIFGRITAIADVFDALGAKRIYKDAMPDEKIKQIMEDGKAKHFDPILTTLFLENYPQFVEIRTRFS